MIPVEKMIYAVWITMAVLGTAFLIGGTVIAVHFLAKVW